MQQFENRLNWTPNKKIRPENESEFLTSLFLVLNLLSIVAAGMGRSRVHNFPIGLKLRVGLSLLHWTAFLFSFIFRLGVGRIGSLKPGSSFSSFYCAPLMGSPKT